jgi:hypothetical protein
MVYEPPETIGELTDPPLEPPSPEASLGGWVGDSRPVLGSRVGVGVVV